MSSHKARTEAAHAPSEVEEVSSAEIRALRSLGFSKPFLVQLSERAARNGSSVEAELLATGRVSEDAYYGAMARALRLPFIRTISSQSVMDVEDLDKQLILANRLHINHRRTAAETAIVPSAGRLAEVMATLERLPELARGLVITTPSAIRKAVWQAGAKRRVAATVSMLFERAPEHSARIVASGWQGFIGGMLVSAIALGLWLDGQNLVSHAHVTMSLLYFCALLLRIVALVRQKHVARRRFTEPQGPFPIYTVMVALYREAGMIPQLVASLERLEWPRSRLDIKLVCEADDQETLEAIRVLKLPPYFEVVEVPPQHPRTKPKALTYALSAVRGDYVAIYDAEDRPHPKQLLEAYSRFQRAGPELACLQSPLIIANMRASFISSLFAVEYAALFRGLLPMLGRYRLPMPLGGTSNHFRGLMYQKHQRG
ncbi:glycosyltransferase [Rhizobium oryzicola]|uniref:Glycosyltransferase n=1 Tax=Rhizobium oryzicola TaxID=1232668 RepID=A0ABT8SR88_9HYPH|nr:glycosyltransferase [Rhizobium oryzicola]MDO1580881.1 glycosyltransferase [Rhizobium oryzicola]